jgi:serine aminopeptidase S33 family
MAIPSINSPSRVVAVPDQHGEYFSPAVFSAAIALLALHILDVLIHADSADPAPKSLGIIAVVVVVAGLSRVRARSDHDGRRGNPLQPGRAFRQDACRRRPPLPRCGRPDGVQLSGSYIPSRNGAAVLTIPGGGETRDGIFDQAVVVARNGYGVLDLDTRGHGPSQGTPMDFGWFGDLDVAAGISFLSAQEEVDPSRITALGLSMGGEEALTAAATDPRLRASGSRITLRALPIVARLREMGARPASPRSRARRQTGTDLPPALQALSPRERDLVGLVVRVAPTVKSRSDL